MAICWFQSESSKNIFLMQYTYIIQAMIGHQNGKKIQIMSQILLLMSSIPSHRLQTQHFHQEVYISEDLQ